MMGIEKAVGTNCRTILGAATLLLAIPAFAQQPRAALDETTAYLKSVDQTQPITSEETRKANSTAALPDSTSDATLPASSAKPVPASTQPRKLGPLTVSVNWRFRTEAWDWFQPATGQNAYAFDHSLLRIGLGQKSENFDWFLEGAQDSILDLPTGAIVSGTPGQLGLGGTYYAANGKGQNNANGFVRQAYVGFKLTANVKLRLGRFTFLDGAEVTTTDQSLVTLVNMRITLRLIG